MLKDCVQEHPSNGVVTTVVGIFDIRVKPVIRIAGIVSGPPELPAMRAMSKKCLVQRHVEYIIPVAHRLGVRT